MNRVLIIVSLVLAIIASILGFDLLSTDGDPHVVGWLAASLAAYVASLLVP